MKKNTKKIIAIVLLSILIIVSLFYFLIRNHYSKLEVLVKDVFNVFTYPFIERSKEDQTESYLIQKNVNKALLEEIDSLKKLLD